MNALKKLAAGVVAVAGSATAASAVTAITIEPGSFQQQENAPCIISQTPSCKNPDGFDFTLVDQGGNVFEFDALSPVFSVSQIRDVVGDSFFVGLDVGQAGSDVQTLDLFQLLINNILVSQFLLGGNDDAANIPAATNPGNGFSDQILVGFASLVGLANDATVQFRAVLSNLNNGPESFFLIANGGDGGNSTVIPLPAGGVLLLTALASLGFASWRRRAA